MARVAFSRFAGALHHARHAKAALSMQINKSDRNDATGIARIMQAGWYRAVQVKRLACHAVRAVLNSRALVIKMKRDLENQIRGLLKNFGLFIGKAGGNVFTARVRELVADVPLLQQAIWPLLTVRNSVVAEIAAFDRKLLKLARDDDNSRRLMTVPGIGPITALAFVTVVDQPERFKRSRSVGAYIGLTPRCMPPARLIGPDASPSAAIRCCDPICLKLQACC